MNQRVPFDLIPGLDLAEQVQWKRSLRPRTASIELVFHDGDANHLLATALAWLAPLRHVGVGARPGYQRPQPSAVLHRYRYDRSILQAVADLGGLFEYVSAPTGDSVTFTRVGNVDVTFLDHSDTVIGSTVTHEGLILTPRGPSGTPPR